MAGRGGDGKVALGYLLKPANNIEDPSEARMRRLHDRALQRIGAIRMP
jgi:hypothetical protein